MKFGPVPVAEAEGAILAHSLRLPGGRLRKGVRLDASHVQALVAAGLDDVVVARLDPTDLHEDEAARALAAALGEGRAFLQQSEAFTGRVNLVAERPGVVCIEAEAIHAANAIDPSITIATVPPHHQIHRGGMVATVKIIPYGVDGAAVARACEAARGAISLAPPVHATASLIVSEIDGTTGPRGVEAIANRLTGLEVELVETLTCRHEDRALAERLLAATGDIILIITGSATSDACDTAPAALVAAGGVLERFGMPVDPGNLLFLGRLGDKPVVGLPGSARSPVLHGADWVLSRVACGIPVGDAEIARMGVGGLLKEIPTRPQPRRGRSVK
ncbi:MULTISPECIES: molybdopterin-binding protein [unclassified Roseovarius]|uniref:molybdopterin-binding protein n=1 Tax=unclassified Roseovarius TaxID=2614913 RepID=UPI00273F5C36|nr:MULTISPECIES: molybdopterin-binding protein [unclassified Roseovarius]